jgi:hypothetical protein
LETELFIRRLRPHWQFAVVAALGEKEVTDRLERLPAAMAFDASASIIRKFTFQPKKRDTAPPI